MTVPRSWVGTELKVNTVSADALLSNLNISNVEIDTVSADTTCTNLVCDTLDLKSVSGSIRCDGQVNEQDVQSVSGNCDLTPTNPPKDISMNSGSGDLTSDFPVSSGGKAYSYGNGSCTRKAETVSGDLTIRSNNMGEA